MLILFSRAPFLLLFVEKWVCALTLIVKSLHSVGDRLWWICQWSLLKQNEMNSVFCKIDMDCGLGC